MLVCFPGYCTRVCLNGSTLTMQLAIEDLLRDLEVDDWVAGTPVAPYGVVDRLPITDGCQMLLLEGACLPASLVMSANAPVIILRGCTLTGEWDAGSFTRKELYMIDCQVECTLTTSTRVWRLVLIRTPVQLIEPHDRQMLALIDSPAHTARSPGMILVVRNGRTLLGDGSLLLEACNLASAPVLLAIRQQLADPRQAPAFDSPLARMGTSLQLVR